jgi:glycine/D-amino acid oxidase-like deaminating enzyme
MSTRYGRSPWVDGFPKSRVPAYPKHRGSEPHDVVIIGGGLTGCATAYAFAAAGIKVLLLEADRIGRGSSATVPGWLSEEPGADFTAIEKRLGRREARYVWQSWRRSALDFAALIRRLDIKCHLEPAAAHTVALSPDQAARLAREQKARKAAGLDVSLTNGRAIQKELALDAAGGLRSREGATLDPYRATLGLAAAAAGRGAQIFEATPVKKVTFTRKYADVFTESGSIRTTRVIVATGTPTPLYRSLVRHFWLKRRYLVLTEPVPAKIRQAMGSRGLVIADTHVPPRLIRWVDDARLLVSGADSDVVADRQREKTVIQRTGQLMYELSTLYPDISGVMPAFGWDTDYALTAEALPYIGSHRNFPFHLFAFGDSSAGVTGAYLASRLFLRQHLGEATAQDDAFGFLR